MKSAHLISAAVIKTYLSQLAYKYINNGDYYTSVFNKLLILVFLLVYLQSDVLFGLLEELNTNTESAPLATSVPTTGSQVPTTPSAIPTHPTLVGPTTAELESINELIQFDHVYYKPSQVSPVKQAGLVSVLKPVTKTSPASPKLITASQVQKKPRNIMAKSATVEAPLGLNLGEMDLEKLSDTLEQVADFDKMFKQLAESHSVATVDMVSASDNAVRVDKASSRKRKLNNNHELSTQVSAKKSKHTDNVKNVNLNISMATRLSDTLTTPDPLECGYQFDFEDRFGATGLNYSDSEYGSDASFSPSSDLPSPCMPETTGAWEESFTELFPSLL